MEQPTEEPKRVTPTEARAKLLRSLIATPNDSERLRQDEARTNFIREMLQQDEFSSGR